MTDDTRRTVAWAACELLKSRSTREARHRALTELANSIGGGTYVDVVHHMRTVLETVLDCDYAIKGAPEDD